MKAKVIKPFISKATDGWYFAGDEYEGEDWQIANLVAQGLVTAEGNGGAAKAAPPASVPTVSSSSSVDFTDEELAPVVEPEPEPQPEPEPKPKRTTTRKASTTRKTTTRKTTTTRKASTTGTKRGPGRPRKTAE